MRNDAIRMRDGGPLQLCQARRMPCALSLRRLRLRGTAVSQIKHGVGVPEIVDHILSAWSKATGSQKRPLKQQRTA